MSGARHTPRPGPGLLALAVVLLAGTCHAQGARSEGVRAAADTAAARARAVERRHDELRAALGQLRVRIVELEGRRAALVAERAKALEELRAGLFCTGCSKTRSELLATEGVFPHPGQQVRAATAEELERKEREFDLRLAGLDQELDRATREVVRLEREAARCWSERWRLATTARRLHAEADALALREQWLEELARRRALEEARQRALEAERRQREALVAEVVRRLEEWQADRTGMAARRAAELGQADEANVARRREERERQAALAASAAAARQELRRAEELAAAWRRASAARRAELEAELVGAPPRESSSPGSSAELEDAGALDARRLETARSGLLAELSQELSRSALGSGAPLQSASARPWADLERLVAGSARSLASGQADEERAVEDGASPWREAAARARDQEGRPPLLRSLGSALRSRVEALLDIGPSSTLPPRIAGRLDGAGRLLGAGAAAASNALVERLAAATTDELNRAKARLLGRPLTAGEEADTVLEVESRKVPLGARQLRDAIERVFRYGAVIDGD